MDVAKTIKSSNLFNTLSDEEIKKILDITTEKRFLKGDVIMQEDEAGDTMYIIVGGEVEVSKSLTMKFGEDDFRQKEKVLTRFGPEDHAVFGEMAIIGQYNRSASITARTDCLLLQITRDDFLRLIEADPAMGVKILMKISESLITRLREASQNVIRLTTALSIALSP